MQADFTLVEKRQEGGLMNCESPIKCKKTILDGTSGILMKILQWVNHAVIVKFNESVSKRDFIKLLNEKRVENWKEK